MITNNLNNISLNSTPEVSGRSMTGGEIVIESLINHGVRYIFGIPGGANLPIYDALPKYEERGLIKHILTAHEQGAIHAAQGLARATGNLGVCFATSGPGATNLVTGLQDAKSDSTPVLAITGQVSTSLIGTDAFQETDVVGVTRPCTKYNSLVKNIGDLATQIEKSIFIATHGRPGPVLIDIPKDISSAATNPIWPTERSIRDSLASYVSRIDPIPNQALVEEALKLIKNSKRPILYVGGGVVSSGAYKELFEFANKMQIPVTTTFMALDSFPATNPLSLKAPGMHGSIAANYALNTSDCIIAVGARFDDRVTGKLSEFAKKAKIIHIDMDASEINKIRRADVPLRSDVKKTLEAMLDLIPEEKGDRYKEWIETVQEWKSNYPFRYIESKDGITPQKLITQLYELTRDRQPIITTGVGQHQMWTTQFYDFTKPRTFISSLGLATMGYGLPAAIGAQVAKPNDLVIDIDGDGSFLMTMQELAVVAREQLPIKMLILDNKRLGMVTQWQRNFYRQNYSGVDIASGSYPDFVKAATGFGIEGKRISDQREVLPALEKMINHPKAYILQADVDESAEVYPIIGPGKSWREIEYPFKPLPSI